MFLKKNEAALTILKYVYRIEVIDGRLVAVNLTDEEELVGTLPLPSRVKECLNRPAAPKPPDLAHMGLIFQICRAIFMEAHGNFVQHLN